MKNILITGAARGIGRGTALLCGARDWSVAINFPRDRSAADGTAAVKAAGGNAITVRGDVSVEEDVIRMFSVAQEALGFLGGIVINAGITAPTMPLGRPGRAEEVAEAIVWLLSDAASYTTGAILDVAGGR